MAQTVAPIAIGGGEVGNEVGGIAIGDLEPGLEIVPLLVRRNNEERTVTMGGDGRSKHLADRQPILDLAHASSPVGPAQAFLATHSSPGLVRARSHAKARLRRRRQPQRPLKLGGRFSANAL